MCIYMYVCVKLKATLSVPNLSKKRENAPYPSGTHSKDQAEAMEARLLKESQELQQSMCFRRFGAWCRVANGNDD